MRHASAVCQAKIVPNIVPEHLGNMRKRRERVGNLEAFLRGEILDSVRIRVVNLTIRVHVFPTERLNSSRTRGGH